MKNTSNIILLTPATTTRKTTPSTLKITMIHITSNLTNPLLTKNTP